MGPFEYARPESETEAVEFLNEHGGNTAVLAGGTDLLNLLKADLAAPDRVVDLKQVPSLREIILGLAPSISEDVKYGGILFSAGQPFCGVFSYAKHASLEFGAGASLPDNYKVLEGEGKLRRHIKLSSAQDIPGKHVREYLALALKASFKP